MWVERENGIGGRSGHPKRLDVKLNVRTASHRESKDIITAVSHLFICSSTNVVYSYEELAWGL